MWWIKENQNLRQHRSGREKSVLTWTQHGFKTWNSSGSTWAVKNIPKSGEWRKPLICLVLSLFFIPLPAAPATYITAANVAANKKLQELESQARALLSIQWNQPPTPTCSIAAAHRWKWQVLCLLYHGVSPYSWEYIYSGLRSYPPPFPFSTPPPSQHVPFPTPSLFLLLFHKPLASLSEMILPVKQLSTDNCSPVTPPICAGLSVGLISCR